CPKEEKSALVLVLLLIEEFTLSVEASKKNRLGASCNPQASELLLKPLYILSYHFQLFLLNLAINDQDMRQAFIGGLNTQVFRGDGALLRLWNDRQLAVALQNGYFNIRKVEEALLPNAGYELFYSVPIAAHGG